MKKQIAKIREWLRAIFREELALVIVEFHEVKDIRLARAEDEAAKLLQDFEQKLVAEAAVVVSEKNKLIEELHTKLAEAQHVAAKITHWRADGETLEADHSLKMVK